MSNDASTHLDTTAGARDDLASAAAAGDDEAFALAMERYRRELWGHCRRIVRSSEEADDAVQETFLRAWRRRATFAGRSSLRAWLYSIATNVCFDALRHRQRRPSGPVGAAWTEPGSRGGRAHRPGVHSPAGRPHEEPAATDAQPDVTVVAKETIEHALLAVIQHLPPRQRGVLVLRDVLGWSARDTASLLRSSVAATNSALQRARTTLAVRAARPLEWTPAPKPTAEERTLLRRLVEAHERADAAAVARLVA